MSAQISAGSGVPASTDYRTAHLRMVVVALCLLMLLVGTWVGLILGRVDRRASAAPPELKSSFTEVASAIEPAVVNISTVTKPSDNQPGATGQDEDSTREGRAPSGREMPKSGTKRGNGSGVIIDPSGYILTNNHVIEGADRIRVKLDDGTDLRAQLVGADRETDLAVIKIEPPRKLQAVRIGDSEKMRVGDWVLAIGAPFGFEQTVTAGIISSTNRDSNDLYHRVGFQFFLQTDAAINRGNSGGPLINLAGEVIGINTAIATSTGDYNGICFALPSSEALLVYRQLVRDGRVTRGFLGALTERVTPQIAKIFGLPVPNGAIVSNVSEKMEVDGAVVESPAARAGLKARDVIIEFNGDRIRDDGDLVRKVAVTPVGTSAPLRIYRAGKELNLTVTIGRRPGRISPETDRARRDAADPSVSADRRGSTLGIRIESITPQIARQKELGNLRGCLVLRVEPGSIADDAELKANDIIEEINRQPVRDNDGLKRILNQLRSGDPIVLQVYRENLNPVPRIFLSLSKP